VDDGSSDDSAEIASAYGARVMVIRQANRGVSGARNTGIAAAQAPYIALLDQDDVWQPGKLARQLELIEAHPQVGIVFTDMRVLKPDGAIVEDGFLATTEPYAALDRQSLGNQAYLLSEALGQAVMRFNFISPSTTLLRLAAIQEIGGFDESLSLCDDAECWMRLLHRWRGIAIEESLVLSLLWEGNASLRWERLLCERLIIGRKTATYPALFPPGAATYFQKERPIAHYRLGMVALHSGDVATARRHFGKSFRDRRRFSTALLFCATMLPAPLRKGLLRAKRAAGLRWSLHVE
jgi:glycosyltransferase involved in cell wall biosynthesis